MESSTVLKLGSKSPDSIIFVTAHYPPPENAAGFRLKAMVKAISKNLDFSILVIDLTRNKIETYYGDYGERVLSPRKSLSRSSKLYYFHRFKDMLDLSKTYNFIKKYIESTSLKPRLIISTIPPGESVKIGAKLAKDFRAKLLVDFHDLTDEWRFAENPAVGIFYKIYFNKYVYSFLDKADAITTTTEYSVFYLRRKMGNTYKTIHVIYNGVDPVDFEKAYDMKAKKRSRDLRIVFVGNLNWKYHRLDIFIKAMKEITRKEPDSKLVVIGKGKYLSEYVSLAKKLDLLNKIVFTGYISKQRLIEELGKADFGLIPRPAINNPWVISSDRITFYEYLASGLPVIAYGPKINYIGSVIEKYDLGIYIRSNDHKIISTEIIQNRDQIRSIGSSHVRNYILKYRTWDRIMEKFIKIIQKII